VGAMLNAAAIPRAVIGAARTACRPQVCPTRGRRLRTPVHGLSPGKNSAANKGRSSHRHWCDHPQAETAIDLPGPEGGDTRAAGVAAFRAQIDVARTAKGWRQKASCRYARNALASGAMFLRGLE
jgi:hypothetical protein